MNFYDFSALGRSNLKGASQGNRANRDVPGVPPLSFNPPPLISDNSKSPPSALRNLIFWFSAHFDIYVFASRGTGFFERDPAYLQYPDKRKRGIENPTRKFNPEI